MCCQEWVDTCTVIYYGRVWSRDTVTVPCVWWSKPSVNKSNTGVRTLISHHKRRTLVTLKILFFVEQENAWDFHCAEWERERWDSSKMRESHARCVRLGRSVYMDHYTGGNYEFLLHGGKRCKLASTGHFWVRKEKQSAVVYRIPCKECAAHFL